VMLKFLHGILRKFVPLVCCEGGSKVLSDGSGSQSLNVSD